MRTWTLHFRYEEAHSSCFPGMLSRPLGFPRVSRVSIRFGRSGAPRARETDFASRGRTRALVSSLTSGSSSPPPRFSTSSSRPARGPLSKRAVKERRRTKSPPSPPHVERLSARLRYLSPLLLVAKDDRAIKTEREETREKKTPPSLPLLPRPRRDK